MTRALVTGGSGFVGEYLLEALEKEGTDTANFDMRHALQADIRNYESLRAAIDVFRPDYIFNLAAQAYVPESTLDPHRGIDVNVEGTLNLLEAVRSTGSQARILLAGTSEEYGYEQDGPITEESPTFPTTVYGVSKLSAGHLGLVYARQYGMNVVVTRTTNHTGPGHPPIYAIPSFAKRVADVEAGRIPAVVHGNLEAIRNYLDVRDVVKAYRLAIDLPSGTYNISSPFTVSMQWVLDTLCQLTGKNIPRESQESLYRAGNTHFPEISSAKLSEATGWKPEHDINETLENVLNYWREQ